MIKQAPFDASAPKFELDFDLQLHRTFSVVKALSEGKRLTLKSGYTIAMGEDMSIGFLGIGSDGLEHVLGLSTIDLKELNSILNEEGVLFII